MLELRLARFLAQSAPEPIVQELAGVRAPNKVLAPEAASLGEPAARRFFSPPSSSDHLRLPQRTRLDGPSMRAAVRRVLDVDTRRTAASEDAVIKEERMRRVLAALNSAAHHLHRGSISA